ncbi:fungal transcription factor [Colletotrichum tofieldiae]|nr:fungal transcription factor [Colletotrichum tofieldiae]GKT74380.1 fungal transcription factor [Colletotrichum tofieldiae]
MPLADLNVGHSRPKGPEGHRQASVEQIHENTRDCEDADVSVVSEYVIPNNEQHYQDGVQETMHLDGHHAGGQRTDDYALASL